MKKEDLMFALKRRCQCYFDKEHGEHWKCVQCDARDYIQLLASRLEEIGCAECDSKIKEMLE